ncbi:LysR family transcriptional regulator (plasmid) [Rhizobium sp. RCAM05350]|nr:LysR family transcriptional regulator [Rhizobium sp. RCAM05350]
MVDLNLIRAFIAIYETESVSRAAAKLNLSQPSVSHALNRLRICSKIHYSPAPATA